MMEGAPFAPRGTDKKKRGGDSGRGGGEPPKWNWQAEVIAPSTIFFGRKYCYRQIGDSITCRRWGSRLWSKGCVCVSSAVEVAVSPDALSLMPGLFSPAHPSLFSPPPVPSAAFTFHILLPHHMLPHSIRLLIAFLASFLQGVFSPFSSVDYVCLKGKTPFSPTQQALPPSCLFLRLFLCCQCARIMLILSWRIPLIWLGLKNWSVLVSVFGFQRSELVVKPEQQLFWTYWCYCRELLRDKNISTV